MDCPDTALRLDGKAPKNVMLDCAGRSIVVDSGSAIVVSGVSIKNCVMRHNRQSIWPSPRPVTRP